MTASSWTKSEIAAAFADCANLREVISKLEARANDKGEVICEISVNGIALNEADEAAFGASPLETIESLEIQSRRPLDLVRDALRSAADLLPQLERSALSTAELLRAGDRPRSARSFEETIGGSQWLVETLMHVRSASRGLGRDIVQPQEWAQSEQLIGRVVGEVSDAYQRADQVLVADLLEYEMTAALASWKSVVAAELD